MHFSKTYSQLLLTIPDELRNSAIDYRQLKKLINELVVELDSLGLSPLVLREILQNGASESSHQAPTPAWKGKERTWDERFSELGDDSRNLSSVSIPELGDGIPSHQSKAVYELVGDEYMGKVMPRLRLWVKEPHRAPFTVTGRIPESPDDSEDTNGISLSHSRNDSRTTPFVFSENEALPLFEKATQRMQAQYTQGDVVILSTPVNTRVGHDLLWSLKEGPAKIRANSWSAATNVNDAPHIHNSPVNQSAGGHDNGRELVIPLASDAAFFHLLANALNSLSSALDGSMEEFTSSIGSLGEIVARTSRPVSAGGKSDLYTWRAIFQLYMEAQVFESTSERDRGERSIKDAESRLAQFARRVGQGNFAFRMATSRGGFEQFLDLNVRLLNLKKFQNANAEATRKILKKHAKRTALPVPNSATELIPALELGRATASVSHVLLVTLTETLMPVVPHIDDYLCLICTAIAFKPIRLGCGHLFCVRCLVKMQKQGKGNCPMCRAPTVINADKSNVDHALINFMLDWFPKEAKKKARENEHESAKEEMEELGLDTRCVIT